MWQVVLKNVDRSTKGLFLLFHRQLLSGNKRHCFPVDIGQKHNSLCHLECSTRRPDNKHWYQRTGNRPEVFEGVTRSPGIRTGTPVTSPGSILQFHIGSQWNIRSTFRSGLEYCMPQLEIDIPRTEIACPVRECAWTSSSQQFGFSSTRLPPPSAWSSPPQPPVLPAPPTSEPRTTTKPKTASRKCDVTVRDKL